MSRIYVFAAVVAIIVFVFSLREPPVNISAYDNTAQFLPLNSTTSAKAAIEFNVDLTTTNGDSQSGPNITLNSTHLNSSVSLNVDVSNIKDNDIIKVFIGGREVATKTASADDDGSVSVSKSKLEPIANLGVKNVSVAVFRKIDATNTQSKTVDAGTITVDTIGPILNNIDLIGSPETVKTLVLSFRDIDTKKSLAETKENYKVHLLNSLGQPTATQKDPTAANLLNGVVRLTLPELQTGSYRVSIENLTDNAGNNSSPVVLTADFNSFPNAAPQPAVEFPEALPSPQPEIRQKANPGDFVETRVARLYYFRDAHRVAQIINRNTRSYNSAAVTAAQQRYERTRTAYENATDQRRQKEREAVQVSQHRALKDRELQQQQQYVQNLKQVLFSLDPVKQKDQFDEFKEQQVDPAVEKAEQIQSELTQLRSQENQANLQIQQLQDVEDRSAQQEFRERVNSLTADPNTYAAAKTESQDPVHRVSVSVIGEGVLHLRGPIEGINKIRLMINQIDTPLGQIKVGINTVQINGEDARKMEKVAGMVEGHIGLGRHLTMQSLRMLRRAVVEIAGQVAEQSANMGHYQIDRDRKYLYTFFGRDFIDELYEMDSEFLRTENKLLSLHSMDTISLNRALFIFSLAKNDIREMILQRFLDLTQCELPEAEWKYRRSSELFPHRTRLVLPFKRRDKIECRTLEQVRLNAQQRYLFTNLKAFFESEMLGPDTINPMQRTFLRLAQIFKSQLVAEMELKQRIVERFVIEDQREESIREEQREAQRLRQLALEANRAATDEAVQLLENYFSLATSIKRNLNDSIFHRFKSKQDKIVALSRAQLEYLQEKNKERESKKQDYFDFDELIEMKSKLSGGLEIATRFKTTISSITVLSRTSESHKSDLLYSLNNIFKYTQETIEQISQMERDRNQLISRYHQSLIPSPLKSVITEDAFKSVFKNSFKTEKEFASASSIDPNAANSFKMSNKLISDLIKQDDAHRFYGEKFLSKVKVFNENLSAELDSLAPILDSYFASTSIKSATAIIDENRVQKTFSKIMQIIGDLESLNKGFEEPSKLIATVKFNLKTINDSVNQLILRQRQRQFWKETITSNRSPLDQKKLLDHLIEERTEKYVELLEGTRSYISVVDNYLKRMAMALEDDFKIQFYDPAFTRIRLAAGKFPVSLGQIERTNVLMNNRSLAVVQPTATMEFNMPHRDIFIIEAMDNAKSLVSEYGALLKDPTFLAAFDMFGGASAANKVQNVLPGMGTQNNEASMGLTGNGSQQFGDNLNSRVPDPAIYKFETGTGFEIRPVIQPDGDSVVYNLNYMYTTNIREPVNPNEKHLGRIRRHFINTQVQTSSFAMREVSRYQVALKAARTGKGVPGLEDIPVVGNLFKPAPSADSSLQQNVILGQSTIYPTLFDLMGLRWAKHVVDLDHVNLRGHDHIVRGRYNTINDVVFDKTSRFVDDFLDVERTNNGKHFRPDLYHPNRQPSPYHPTGYIYEEGARSIKDPTGNEYELNDRRPPEFRQQPPYDPKFRRPIRYDDSIHVQPLGSNTRQNLRPARVSPAQYIEPYQPRKLYQKSQLQFTPLPTEESINRSSRRQ